MYSANYQKQADYVLSLTNRKQLENDESTRGKRTMFHRWPIGSCVRIMRLIEASELLLVKKSANLK
jgi:hypothetical protein